MWYLYEACDQISDLSHQQLLRKVRRKISWTDGRMEGRKDGRTDGRTDRQTDRGKTIYPPQKSDISSQASYRYAILWEAFLDPSDSYFLFADLVGFYTQEKWAYMFNVHKNQQSRQTGSRNLMGPKTLPTIWGTYMKLVTKYQISAILLPVYRATYKWTSGGILSMT
jgi:hypothetical protein